MELFVAMAPSAADGQPAGPGWISCLMPVAFLGIFYALLIRPQQRQQKEHAKMVGQLKSGDRVIAAGMVGTIVKVKENTVELRTAESKVEVTRDSVTRVYTNDGELED